MVEAVLKLLESKLLRKKKKLSAPALTGDKLVRDAGVSPAQLPIEAHDVQGIVFRGYGALPFAGYSFLKFDDAAAARDWLASLVPQIARGVPAADDSALQVAFTSHGLRALGLSADTLEGFSRTFTAGMTGEHRSRFLGDTDDSDPKHWLWGGPGKPQVHVVLLSFAKDASALTQLLHAQRAAWTAAGISEVYGLRAAELSEKEHFGFADGISQPAIDGYHPTSSDLHRVKAGEFLLGYTNEYGAYTERPLLEAAHDPDAQLPLDVEGTPRRDLGRNGTYLVFRQLRQHVPRFRAALDALSRDPDGTPHARARELLAARMVGRWPSGASLTLSPERDDASKAKSNDFRYHAEDGDGLKCPIGAHVRRANPRDALDPKPGTERSLSVNRRHRLIRRGRLYGDKLAEGAVDDADRGIMFIAVNANITRQFEFVQHSWLLDPHFNGFSRAADPIAGAIPENEFVTPGNPLASRCTGLPRFVTTVGGAYFFLPGLRALRFISEQRS